MMRSISVLIVGLLVGSSAFVWSQSDVNLRSRIVSEYTQQMVFGNCGVEFRLQGAPGEDPKTWVCFGGNGVGLYRYSVGSTPERVGHFALGAIADVDVASGDTAQQAYLALGTGSPNYGVHLVRVDSSGVVTPYGVASLGASRVQIERIGSGSYLVVVGTTGGRLRVYAWSPGAPASSPYDTLSLGTPAVDLPLFPGAVRALRVWTVSGTVYVAVGGIDGMVYLFRWSGTGLVQVGKAQYHPSPIAEIVVNGSRLVVGCTNGQVYVWNYTSSGMNHHLTLKEPWAPLGSYSLCALPNDQVAVATSFVRVYRLSDGVQTGEYGAAIWGNYLRDFYVFPEFPCYVWHPSFYRVASVKVLPSVASGNYFVVTAPDYEVAYQYYGHTRTVFMASGGFSYQVTARPYPVYALAYVASGVASGHSDGEVRAPWGTRNVSLPVFSLLGFASGTTSWLLGSYGVGRLFAWSSGNAFVADVLPTPSSPRIIYGMGLVSVASNQVTFVTCSGDGWVELWSWTIGSSTPATLLSSRRVNAPLYSLSVNADRTQVAVATRNAAWRLPLSGNTLGSPVSIGSYAFVAFHPTDPDLLALGSPFARIALYRPSNGSVSYINVGQIGRSYTYDANLPPDPLLLRWHSSGSSVVGAYFYNGYVGVWWTGADTVVNSRDPVNNANPYRGGYDRALQEMYEPHRDMIFDLLVLPDGTIASGGLDGRIVRWSRAGQVVYSTWHLSPLNSLDFDPVSGLAVYPARVLLSSTRHALLWSNYNWGFRYPGDAVVAARVPGGSGTVRARAVSSWILHDVSDTDVSMRWIGVTFASVPQYTTYRIEVSEDGSWALEDLSAYYRATNPARRETLLGMIPLSGGSGTGYTVSFPDSTDTTGAKALSPSGLRVAIGLGGSEIRVYDRSGSSWSFSTPTSTINIALPTNAFLKFLADDVLAVAYLGTNSILKVDIYQLSGSSWTLRQSLDTGLVRTMPRYTTRYFIDAIAVGSNVRVAIACDTGLVFYRMSRSGGVVSLTEVGRSTWSANGYLDIGGHYWVRFSRNDPNKLSVANGIQAVVYDLTGLFSW